MPKQTTKIHYYKLSKIDQRKYKGQYVAIINDQVVSSGKSAADVFNRAKKRFPKIKTDKIIQSYVPAADLLAV